MLRIYRYTATILQLRPLFYLLTDQIIDGKSAGIGDEAECEQYTDLIGAPPKRRSEKMSSPQNQDTSSDQLLKTMIIQNQRNTEMFQSSLLAILANQQACAAK